MAYAQKHITYKQVAGYIGMVRKNYQFTRQLEEMMRIVNIKKYANKMTQTMYAHVNK
jgi:hypothetical protein